MQICTHEATWVISDYIASPGSNELSVNKGQQVEIIEAPSSNEPDFCLVRLNPQNDDSAVQEGLVPVSILKPPPGSQKTSSTRKDKSDAIQDQPGKFCFFLSFAMMRKRMMMMRMILKSIIQADICTTLKLTFGFCFLFPFSK